MSIVNDWIDRGREADAWAATRDRVREIDETNRDYPRYYAKALGAHLWDVEGTHYLDYILGYGTVILGHANEIVNQAVIEQMNLGTCASPMWSTKQVELAETLCQIIPSAEKAYLMRTGSDATTAAIRLARIHTGRSKVVRWGYNGWHDWACPRPDGVPVSTRDDTLYFEYNDLDSLRRLFANEPSDIACVIVMAYGTDEPEPGFFTELKELCERSGSLFILDEMRSGFRIALGGAQTHYGVIPDLSTFGKAMANGFPISALVGRSDVMMHIGQTHMSSTYFGNAPEMAAALATIEILRSGDWLRKIAALGELFMTGLDAMVQASGAPAEVVGLPVSPFLQFDSDPEAARVKKIFYQETLRRGIMFHPNHQWYISAAHTESDILFTLEACTASLETALSTVQGNRGQTPVRSTSDSARSGVGVTRS